MNTHRKIIAVCGCWLYDDKQYSFLTELNKACSERGYMVAAFNLSIDHLQGEMTVGNELHLMELLKDMPCAATEEFLKQDPLPDAIVCANDVMALAACDVIKKNGLKRKSTR